MKKIAIAVFAALIGSAAAQAGELNTMTAKDVVKAFENIAVTMPAKPSPAVPKIPQFAKDAFKGLQECSIVDAMFIRQPDLKEAVGMLEPCMKAVSKRYGVSVSAKEAKIPDSSGLGIGLVVSGEIMVGNPILRDLNYSIKLHHGGLFGHPAYAGYLKDARLEAGRQQSKAVELFCSVGKLQLTPKDATRYNATVNDANMTKSLRETAAKLPGGEQSLVNVTFTDRSFMVADLQKVSGTMNYDAGQFAPKLNMLGGGRAALVLTYFRMTSSHSYDYNEVVSLGFSGCGK